jgi:toxin YoeB
MGQFIVVLQPTAERDIAAIKKSGDLASGKKIIKIIDELKLHPYEGTGQPEQLKYNLARYWSRRINKKDRLIYKVDEDIVTVFVLSALGHYFDK